MQQLAYTTQKTAVAQSLAAQYKQAKFNFSVKNIYK